MKTDAKANVIEKADMLGVIEKEIAKSSLRKVAKSKSISPAYLSDVRRGNLGISENLALAFGYIREVYTEVRFRPIKGDR